MVYTCIVIVRLSMDMSRSAMKADIGQSIFGVFVWAGM